MMVRKWNIIPKMRLFFFMSRLTRQEEELRIASNTHLVGGLVAIFIFPYIGNNHPN